MLGGLNVNSGTVDSHATSIGSAASYFTKEGLSPTDGKSTITANAKSKAAYNKAQQGVSGFGTAIDKDAKNIRSLGVAFKEFDNMVGNLAKSGGKPIGSLPMKQ
jgi:type VII secretion effector (TIGR04197 family)